MEKWNNDTDYDIKEPTWRKAVEYANKYHTEAGNYRIDKTGNKIPYITHIKGVLKILIDEAHIRSDDILTVAALHDVLEDTSCNEKQLETDFGSYITDAVVLLTRKEGQPFEEYAKLVFTNSKYPWLGVIKLADRIHNLRTYPEVNNKEIVNYKYDETLNCILPYAQEASPILSKKLNDSLDYIKNYLNDDNMDR